MLRLTQANTTPFSSLGGPGRDVVYGRLNGNDGERKKVENLGRENGEARILKLRRGT